MSLIAAYCTNTLSFQNSLRDLRAGDIINIYLIKSHRILTHASRQASYHSQNVDDDYFCEGSDDHRRNPQYLVPSNSPGDKSPALRSTADGFVAVTQKILGGQDDLLSDLTYVYNFFVTSPEQIIYFSFFDDKPERDTRRSTRPTRASQWEGLDLGIDLGLDSPRRSEPALYSRQYASTDLYGLNLGSTTNRDREAERARRIAPVTDILEGSAATGFGLQSNSRRPAQSSSFRSNSRYSSRAQAGSQSAPSLARLRSPPITLSSDRRSVRRPETPTEFFSLEPRTPILDSPQPLYTRRSEWPPLRLSTSSPEPTVMRPRSFQLRTPASSVFGDDDITPFTPRPGSPFLPDLPLRALPKSITKLVEATTYQSDEYYFRATQQDAAISLVAMAIVTIYDVSKWTSASLDQIIHAGDKLYRYTRLLPNFRTSFVSLDDVHQRFIFNSQYHEMSINDQWVHGPLSPNILEQGIVDFFRICNCKAGALHIKDQQKYMTIFEERSVYYMFDSQKRNLVGGDFYQYAGDSAVLIGFVNVRKMAEAIVRNVAFVDNILDLEEFRDTSYSGDRDGYEIFGATRARFPNQYDITFTDIGPPMSDGGFQTQIDNDEWL